MSTEKFFVGVDVFLVLSGYLITQQITKALDEARFELGRFWLRRARRLLPAMLPVLAFAALSALILKGDADLAGTLAGKGLGHGVLVGPALQAAAEAATDSEGGPGA